MAALPVVQIDYPPSVAAGKVTAMSDGFDPADMAARFVERAQAAIDRNLPPVGGDERQMFLRQRELDHNDFSLVGKSEPSLADGVLSFEAGEVPDGFDGPALVARFRERALAVRSRNAPAVAGPERQAFIKQAEEDFMDFAMLGDADPTVEDGALTLRIDLRPKD